MKVAIVGYGLEGKASYDYWNTADNQLTIVDEREIDVPNGAAMLSGREVLSKLDSYDLIIRSPSVNPRKLPYGNKVWSATNEFFSQCPCPIIGVTGTKGKGTTCSLITSILRAAGKRVHLVGNIGTPALGELAHIEASDIVVFELSSFQLWDLQTSPHIAVVLAIEPDHLDVHDDIVDYIAAKANITRWQTGSDVLVFNQTNKIAQHIADDSSARTVGYINDDVMNKFADSLVIPGRHNVENAAAAIAAVSEYTASETTIKAGLHAFTGLPHRIKFVRDHANVRYYDDSYSSAPAASIAALKSFVQPKIIILGGYEKHADFTELARYISSDARVKKALLIGQTKQRIAQSLQAANIDPARYDVVESANFAEIVTLAQNYADAGDVVLLSPACASFDMFKNFTDRGEQFVRIVNELS